MSSPRNIIEVLWIDMPSDEEIRSLCARVVNARGKEFDAAIADLQLAIEQRLAEHDEPEADESR